MYYTWGGGGNCKAAEFTPVTNRHIYSHTDTHLYVLYTSLFQTINNMKKKKKQNKKNKKLS